MSELEHVPSERIDLVWLRVVCVLKSKWCVERNNAAFVHQKHLELVGVVLGDARNCDFSEVLRHIIVVVVSVDHKFTVINIPVCEGIGSVSVQHPGLCGVDPPVQAIVDRAVNTILLVCVSWVYDG